MARSHYVEHARKSPGHCGRCDLVIRKRDPYYWWKFRYGGKHIRCIEHRPRQSDLTSSDKLSTLYAAQEGLEDSIAAARKKLGQAQVARYELAEAAYTEAFKAVLELKGDAESCKDEAQTVADEYNESADNIEQTFSSSPTADLCRENAEQIEEWTSGFDQVETEIDDAMETFQGKLIQNLTSANWFETMLDEARRKDDEAFGAALAVGVMFLPLEEIDDYLQVVEDAIDSVESHCGELPL